MIKEETARAQPATRASTCEWRHQKKKNGVLLKQWIYRDALKPVAELDGTGALVSEFVFGSKSNVPDYVRRGGNTYRVVSDQLGSPRYVVNVSNASDVPFTATYTSFGVVTGTGLDWMPFGFAGGHYDPDTGLIRFGARDYDPQVGRWTAQDPLRFDAGSDFYSYVLLDPVNGVDSSGLDPLPVFQTAQPSNIQQGISNFFNWLFGGGPWQGGSGSSSNGPPPGSGGGPNMCGVLPPDCDGQWQEAYRRCADIITGKQTPERKRLRGKPDYDINDCARGFVSAECGGNPI
jgi:RHS repeat-associated protein